MENRCVCCDEIIPEGRQICWKCEHKNSIKHLDKLKLYVII